MKVPFCCLNNWKNALLLMQILIIFLPDDLEIAKKFTVAIGKAIKRFSVPGFAFYN
jgi:hypothetical protein